MKKRLELLSPVNYEIDLKSRVENLERLIKSKQTTLNSKAHLQNAGKIRIVRHKSTLQFYLITKKNDTTGKYLTRSQDDFAKNLIQYDYETKVVKAAKKELYLIKKLLLTNKKSGVQRIFQKFSQNRKGLVEPVTLPDNEFAKQWLLHKCSENGYDNSTEFYTSNGENVRSKSEVIIADTLKRMKIPYKYEVSVDLKNGKTIYPDFCCLNLRTRQEIFWEHFGLMDDPDYVLKTMAKIQYMQESGYYLGRNFIFTMEKPDFPLNSKFVQTMAEKYLV